jgi:hypothetical protein
MIAEKFARVIDQTISRGNFIERAIPRTIRSTSSPRMFLAVLVFTGEFSENDYQVCKRILSPGKAS